jgi:predicted nucleic acid-binding Zn ribbon protein
MAKKQKPRRTFSQMVFTVFAISIILIMVLSTFAYSL